jgi:riboflavin kinase/FMN adenylyltransferase
MIIVKQLTDIPTLSKPIALTLGSFDGLHLGHQFLLHKLKNAGTSCVLTFSNHPSQILSNRPSSCFISTLEHKLVLFEKAGVDLVILLEFTPQLASESYDVFLQSILTYLPFSTLILGEGAAFGKGKQGTEQRIKELGLRLGFRAEYLKKLACASENTISSGKTRLLIQQGDFRQVEKILGRPYSILAHLQGSKLEIKQNLCMPPIGEYSVHIVCDGKNYAGRVQIDTQGLFHVNCEKDLSNHFLEVIF